MDKRSDSFDPRRMSYLQNVSILDDNSDVELSERGIYSHMPRSLVWHGFCFVWKICFRLYSVLPSCVKRSKVLRIILHLYLFHLLKNTPEKKTICPLCNKHIKSSLRITHFQLSVPSEIKSDNFFFGLY